MSNLLMFVGCSGISVLSILSTCVHACRDYTVCATSELQKRLEATGDKGEALWLKEALEDETRNNLRSEPVFTIDPLNSRVRK